MKLRNYLLAGTMTLAFAGAALAITQEEAKQLGNSLTEIGAEKGANKDGSIPAYTGGLTSAPAGYKKGSGRYVDPFKNEKPLFSINKSNMAQYAAHLSPGERTLLEQKPGYRMDIYPTHRTAALPDYVRKNTVKFAAATQLTPDKLSFTGALAGYPFPIPKSGVEAMLNHVVHYRGEHETLNKSGIYVIDNNGRQVLASWGDYHVEAPFWYHQNPTIDPYVIYLTLINAPARAKGQKYMVFDSVKPGRPSRVAWQYLVGQRRVKNAPDMAYDAPNPTIAGGCTSDDSYMFTGPLDRFDWKLVGKKEMYIPYNEYKLNFEGKPNTAFGPKFVNPDYSRWELHRVWVIEATLKPGKRHLYSRRTYYLDEDTWSAVVSEDYDGKGKLYRVGFSRSFQAYDSGLYQTDNFNHYDLIAGGYALGPVPFEDGYMKVMGPLPKKTWNPETLAAGAD